MLEPFPVNIMDRVGMQNDVPSSKIGLSTIFGFNLVNLDSQYSFSSQILGTTPPEWCCDKFETDSSVSEWLC